MDGEGVTIGRGWTVNDFVNVNTIIIAITSMNSLMVN